MKYIKLGMVICVILALFPVALEAQNTMKNDINAIVRGSQGEPLKGAVISTEKDSVLAVTDASGAFSVNVSGGSVLQISALGFRTKIVSATSDLKGIALDADKKLVQVAYRKVDKNDLLGGVSVVNESEMIGKNYTTYSLDNMDALVGGFNGNIWGNNSYLVLVDGVPRDANNVSPTEIDQITFLKGISAVALYGSRGAKGVVYITTKRGTASAQKIDVRANTGMYVPKAYPQYLGSAEYRTLYNEARQNDGLDKLYLDEDIYKYASGTNPYRYPDVNYYSSDYLKKFYDRSDVTAEVSGGNRVARYYTNFGYQTTGSLLNFGEAKDNGRTNRFNVRGNIDIDINDMISCYVNANATFYNGSGVNTDYWGTAATLRPDRYAPLIPISMIEANDPASLNYILTSNYIIDGKYLLGGTQLNQTNPIAAIYAGGTNDYVSRQFQFNTGFNMNLNKLLNGLTFHSDIAVDYATTYNQGYSNSYATYEAAWNSYSGSDLITGLTKYGNDSKTGNQNISNSWYRQTMLFNGQLNYARTFGGVHNFSAMVVAAGYQQGESQIYHQTSNVNLGMQAGYNFKSKYYVDFSGAEIHSAKMPAKNRDAFSPTASLGWRISGENFLSGSSVINNLKITASAGIQYTDLDVSSYYMYDGYYTFSNASWYSWKDGSLTHAFQSRRGANPDLSLPKKEELNLGFEGSFFKNLISIDANYFSDRLSGNIVDATYIMPSYFSVYNSNFISSINYNGDKRTGVDFNVNVNKRIGKVDFTLGFAGMYYNTEATKRLEQPYDDAYQYRQGKPVDAIFGLQNLGFFQDQTDIDNSPKQAFGQVKPGDIKYKDQNGDGIIDQKDEVYLGKYGSPLSLGVHLTVKWKNLTIFALGTGRYGGYGMKTNSYYQVDGEDKYSIVVRDRWTDATKATATYPRLTTKTSDNNYHASDFWMYSTDRFDLSKVQISYSLPTTAFRKYIQGMEIYACGFNLLTIAPNRDILELNIGSAPQTRFYNVGVKATF